MSSPGYIYGFDADELQRLGEQHRTWADTCKDHWDRARFKEGDILLDMGCGPGFASRALAVRVGRRGRVIAIDPSERSIEYMQSVTPAPGSALIDAQVAKAENFEVPESSLNGVYARWVFTFLKDPLRVLGLVETALKPGATCAIFDYFDWQALAWGPHQSTRSAVLGAVRRAFEAHGVDARVGQRVLGAVVDAGLELTEARPVAFLTRPGEPRWHWFKRWTDVFFPSIVANGHLAQSDFDAWNTEWEANSRHPAGYFMTPLQVEITATKR